MDLDAKSPRTDTTHGQISGRLRDNDSIVDFRGIPYAEPPVDDLRWQPPQPPERWNYVRSCKKYSPVAWQRGGEGDFARTVISGLGLGALRTKVMLAAVRWAPMKESEDCLTLNVRAPADADAAPVLVWYHGGDHTDGAGSLTPYRGDALVERGCVVVTVNYRLGLFGFFSHPELAGDSPGSPIGNVGLLDQIAALEWVRDNISGFGGDPDNVTIFGESAGGQAVLNLMCAPKARGLFHKAVAQSPSDSGIWLQQDRPVLRFEPASEAAEHFGDLVAGAGPGQLDRLRSLDAGDLMAAYRANPEIGRHFYPTIGGAQLPQSPFTAFSRGQQASVPFICGFNTHEGTAFAPTTHPAGSAFNGQPRDADTIGAALRETYGDVGADSVLRAHPGLLDDEPDAVAGFLGARMFEANVEHVSRAHAAAGHPTYRYVFGATPPSPNQTIGAFHAAEIGPLFDASIPLVPTGEGYEELRDALGSRWTQFATSGSPTPPGDEPWTAFDPAAPKHLFFDRPTPDGASSATAMQDATTGPALDTLLERFDRLMAADINES